MCSFLSIYVMEINYDKAGKSVSMLSATNSDNINQKILKYYLKVMYIDKL